MNKKFSRIITILLTASLLLTFAASCAEKTDTPKETDNTDAALSDEATVAETELMDKVPELNFDGESLRIIGQGYHITNYMDLGVQETTGDIVLDAIYDRGIYISERFNLKYEEPNATTFEECSKIIKNNVNADDDEYEIVLNQLATSSSDVLNDYFMNLNNVPYIDFSQKWYPSEIKEASSLNGKLFLTVSDMCLTYVGQTWGMVFNKTMAENYHLDDLYDIARNGKWTIDLLYDYAKDVYSDTNGDGKANEGDDFGVSFGTKMNGCMGAAFIYGAGQRFLSVDSDGGLQHLLDSEKAYSIAEKYDKLLNSDFSLLNGAGDAMSTFMRSNIMFISAQLTHMYSYARDYEGAFGVLPVPKYDESQAEYYTLCDAGCNCITVPITCGNLDMAGACIEAMSCYSAKNVNNKYIEVAIETKSARDEESIEMINIILDSRVMDFGYLYCGWDGWTWALSNLYSNVNKYMSKFDSSYKKIDKYYAKVVDKFFEAD